MDLEGDFTASAFVKETTGVDCVCERSAILAGGGAELLLKKAGGKRRDRRTGSQRLECGFWIIRYMW